MIWQVIFVCLDKTWDALKLNKLFHIIYDVIDGKRGKDCKTPIKIVKYVVLILRQLKCILFSIIYFNLYFLIFYLQHRLAFTLCKFREFHYFILPLWLQLEFRQWAVDILCEIWKLLQTIMIVKSNFNRITAKAVV